jgi:hypothetical protein
VTPLNPRREAGKGFGRVRIAGSLVTRLYVSVIENGYVSAYSSIRYRELDPKKMPYPPRSTFRLLPNIRHAKPNRGAMLVQSVFVTVAGSPAWSAIITEFAMPAELIRWSNSAWESVPVPAATTFPMSGRDIAQPLYFSCGGFMTS